MPLRSVWCVTFPSAACSSIETMCHAPISFCRSEAATAPFWLACAPETPSAAIAATIRERAFMSWLSPSPAHQPLVSLGIPSSLHLDGRRGGFDGPDVFGCKLDVRRSEIFFEAIQLRRARDRDDPRLLRQQPGERDLGRGRPLLGRECIDQVDQRLIRFDVVWAEAGNRAAKIGAIECRVRADLAGEEALTQRAERHEPDP